MSPALFNGIAFQLCWFCTAYGVAWGFPWIGPAAVGLSLYVHLRKRLVRPGDFKLLVTIALLGYLTDVALILFGALSFNSPSFLPFNYPLWMTGLWLNLGTCFRGCLAWMVDRPLAAAVLGFFGGPMSYYAGERLGAISMGGESIHLLVTGIAWALVTPLIFKLFKSLGAEEFGASEDSRDN